MLRDYVFHDSTRSFCSKCGELCDAKIIIKNGAAYLLKRCVCGEEIEVFEEDASYLLEKHAYDKPGNIARSETEFVRGCPFDCGLCPDHEQHTCIGLIEVTQYCDLGCPVCYASAGAGEHLPLKRIQKMMEFYAAQEGGKPEILQIGGGEPTAHPHILEILRLARSMKFKYVMLNTNGVRIASEPKFAEALAALVPGFEVYLQFDGLRERTYVKLRGTELLNTKMAALENLKAAGVPVTLVATITRGVNDAEIGDLVRFGMESDFVRGINFQPVAYFGRGPTNRLKDRTTLSGIRREIERQTNGLFKREDIVPLPCDIDRVAVTYAVKNGGEYAPITQRIDVQGYLEIIDNTMDFRAEEIAKRAAARALTKGFGCDCLSLKDQLGEILPKGYFAWSSRKRAEFIDRNTFRITISSFIDRYNFDAKSIKKECVHVITPDLKRIPFSAYNMLHRDGARAAQSSAVVDGLGRE